MAVSVQCPCTSLCRLVGPSRCRFLSSAAGILELVQCVPSFLSAGTLGIYGEGSVRIDVLADLGVGSLRLPFPQNTEIRSRPV